MKDLFDLEYPKFLVDNGHPWHQSTLDAQDLSSKALCMCAWALEMLQLCPASPVLDFRFLYKFFAAAHGGKIARCLAGNQSCNRTSPEAYKRFTDIKVMWQEQSVYAQGCQGCCDRLLWDRSSYGNIQGSRAVDIWEYDTTIKYYSTDEGTIAISYITSHGHCGTPRGGINRCLHVRFSRLAK